MPAQAADADAGAFQETLATWLRGDRLLPKAQRRTARRLFEGLQVEGYLGAYDSVQRFVRGWKLVKSGPSLTQVWSAPLRVDSFTRLF